MGRHAEAISRWARYLSRSSARRLRRWVKKELRRARRRAERAAIAAGDPAAVDRRQTRGWAD